MMYIALSYDHRIVDGKEAVYSSSIQTEPRRPLPSSPRM